jgi:hypothetical protein
MALMARAGLFLTVDPQQVGGRRAGRGQWPLGGGRSLTSVPGGVLAGSEILVEVMGWPSRVPAMIPAPSIVHDMT